MKGFFSFLRWWIFISLSLLLFACVGIGEKPILKVTEKAPILIQPVGAVPRFQIKQNQPFNPFPYIQAEDKEDGDLSARIKIKRGSFNIRVAGLYPLVYVVCDSHQNETELAIEIEVLPPPPITDQPPVISLYDQANQLVGAEHFYTLRGNSTYRELGYEVSDDIDKEIDPDNVVITIYKGIEPKNENRVESVDPSLSGMFLIEYVVVDSSGNSCKANRFVIASTQGFPPLITLNKHIGSACSNPADPTTGSFYEQTTDGKKIVLECNIHQYEDPGVSVYDTDETNLYYPIIRQTHLPENAGPGSYSIIYTVTDSDNNSSIAKRVVVLEDRVVPLLSFQNIYPEKPEYNALYFIKQQQHYYESQAPQVEVFDVGDVNLSSRDVECFFFQNSVDPANEVETFPAKGDSPGKNYWVRYKATDSSGNESLWLDRKVTLVDGKAPLIEFEPKEQEFTFLPGAEWKEPGVLVYDLEDRPTVAATISQEPKAGVKGYLLPYGEIGEEPVSPNDPAVPPRYRGRYSVDKSELCGSSNTVRSEVGMYRVRYIALDNLKEFFPEGYNRLPDNRSEKIRTVYVLGTPVWNLDQDFHYFDSENAVFQLRWNHVLGASGYKIYRAESSNSPANYQLLQEIQSGDSLSFVTTVNEGVFYYKISAFYRYTEGVGSTAEQKEIETPLSTKFLCAINLPHPLASLAINSTQTGVSIRWDRNKKLNGYRLYAIPKLIYDKLQATEFRDYQIAQITESGLGGELFFSYVYPAKYRKDPFALPSPASMQEGAPIDEVVYFVEGFINPTLYGDVSTSFYAGNCLSPASLHARPISSDEMLSLGLKLLYEVSAPLDWNLTPWGDYWNASSSSEELLMKGFSLQPWHVPQRLFVVSVDTGEIENATPFIVPMGVGRSLHEKGRTKESFLDKLEEDDYAFSRYWYDEAEWGGYRVTGTRFCCFDWNPQDWNTKGKMTMKLQIDGFYSFQLQLGWTAFDVSSANYKKRGGPALQSGSFSILPLGQNVPISLTYTPSYHFSW